MRLLLLHLSKYMTLKPVLWSKFINCLKIFLYFFSCNYWNKFPVKFFSKMLENCHNWCLYCIDNYFIVLTLRIRGTIVILYIEITFIKISQITKCRRKIVDINKKYIVSCFFKGHFPYYNCTFCRAVLKSFFCYKIYLKMFQAIFCKI